MQRGRAPASAPSAIDASHSRETACLQGNHAATYRSRQVGRYADNCVAEWEEVGYLRHREAGPGWRGSSHSATSDRLTLPSWTCALAFHGTFDHTLDAKNRLTVPSKLRAALRRGRVPRRGARTVRLAVSADDLFGADRRGPRGLQPAVRRRRASSSASSAPTPTTVELDSAGRVMLAPSSAGARGHRAGRRRHRRRRLLGDLGPRHLGGLRPDLAARGH